MRLIGSTPDRGQVRLAVLAALASAVLATPALATPVLNTPTTSVPSPQPLGTPVTIGYSATDSDAGTLSYRVQVGIVGSTKLSMLRDFSADTSIAFTPELHSGNYQIVITARNNTTLNTSQTTIPSYKFTSLANGGAPVVNSTHNPMVGRLSAPACASGVKAMRAAIQRVGSKVPFTTSWVNCVPGQDMNILLAGMRSATAYTVTPQSTDGTTITNGAPISYTNGTGPALISASTVIPQTSADSQPERVYLLALIAPSLPEAIDFTGAPVWYYADPGGTTPTLTRPIPGGNILMYANGINEANDGIVNSQIFREVDLAGNIVHETNSRLLGDTVAHMAGITQQCYVGGHECVGGGADHEALKLPNGNYIFEMSEEQIFTNGVQGSSPSNPVDLIGDVIVETDANWQVLWYWRSFDWLDVNRAAILGETCTNNQGGCPPVVLTTGAAKDWLHGNAVSYDPVDGSLVFSIRHQDWVVKIDFNNGAGTGAVLWRLGAGGDFTINSSDPYPWFSHQHDPGFVSNGNTRIAMFDNGNTRVAPPPLGLGLPPGTLDGDSRGWVADIDETNKTVTPVLLSDIGFLSAALGTAELLSNGDYHFDAGFGPGATPYAQFVESLPDGTKSFTLQVTGARAYRAIRMNNLYTVPAKD